MVFLHHAEYPRRGSGALRLAAAYPVHRFKIPLIILIAVDYVLCKEACEGTPKQFITLYIN